MSALRHAAVFAAMLTPLACSTLQAQEQPALITAPTAASRAELLRVVTAAVGGQGITLADDALTRDSVLTLERRTPAGSQGQAATGRTLEEPQQFRLVLRGTRCWLVRDADAREWELRETSCAPAAR